MYEVEHYGQGDYSIDLGNSLVLMLPRTSRKLAQAIADSLREAYARGQKDKEQEVNAVLQNAGIDHPLGILGVKDLVQQREGQRARAEEAEQTLAEWRAAEEEDDSWKDQEGLYTAMEFHGGMG